MKAFQLRKSFSHFKKHLQEILPARAEEFKALKKAVTGKQVATVQAEQIMGGMRGIKSMFYDTSIVDNKFVNFEFMIGSDFPRTLDC